PLDGARVDRSPIDERAHVAPERLLRATHGAFRCMRPSEAHLLGRDRLSDRDPIGELDPASARVAHGVLRAAMGLPPRSRRTIFRTWSRADSRRSFTVLMDTPV